MPRRAPRREYFKEEEEDDYDPEYNRRPHRRRRRHIVEEEPRYSRRQKSVPPVEELERFRMRDRSPPDVLRESYGHPDVPGALILEREREEIVPPIPPPPPPVPPQPREKRGKERDRDVERLVGRGRGRPMPREIESENEMVRSFGHPDTPGALVLEREREEVVPPIPPPPPQPREKRRERDRVMERLVRRGRGRPREIESENEMVRSFGHPDVPGVLVLEREREDIVPPLPPLPQQPLEKWGKERDRVGERLVRGSRPRPRILESESEDERDTADVTEYSDEDDMYLHREPLLHSRLPPPDMPRGLPGAYDSDEGDEWSGRRLERPRIPEPKHERSVYPVPIHEDRKVPGVEHQRPRPRDMRPPPPAWPRHSTEDDGSSSEDEEDVSIHSGRQGRGRRHHSEEMIMPVVSRSSSSEPPVSRRSRSIRMSPKEREHKPRSRHPIDDEWTPIPRAPSPESPSSYEEVGMYHRGPKMEPPMDLSPPPREQIRFGRSKEPGSLVRRISPEPHRKEIAIAAPRPRSLESDRELMIVDRGEQDSRDELDLMKADRHRNPKHMYPEPGSSEMVRRRHRERRIREDEDSEEELAHSRGKVGRRYIGVKDRRDRLWTEITKDLVVREAIERTGYEYEETEFFYYIFSYLEYDDISALVELSEDIRRARRRRIHEIHRERASLPPPPPPAPPIADKLSSMLMEPPRPRRREHSHKPHRGRELVLEDRWRPPGRSGRW